MLDSLAKKWRRSARESYEDPAPPEGMTPLSASLEENIIAIRQAAANSGDLVIKRLTTAGAEVALLMTEGMFSLTAFALLLAQTLPNLKDCSGPEEVLEWVRRYSILGADQGEVRTREEVFRLMMSGFVLLLVDGRAVGINLGMQGFSFRGIGEPNSEVNERGSREGFVEPLRINLTLVRRRMKSPNLCFEFIQVGGKVKTDAALIYLSDMVSGRLLRQIRSRLSQVNMDVVLETGYLSPYLEQGPLSIFSGVGSTERPDTLCGKLSEGRVGIMLDGTPFVLVVPYLFTEHFQSFDDYAHRPYYASFIRLLKYISFLFTILLPGGYVAMANFHPELFPEVLLYNVARNELKTPFPLMMEAVIIFFIYEIMREAGLRLPRPVGHAVSIVGALVIGDAAVTAGIIGAPMVMIVALTAISSFVVPSLYEPVTVLRFAFILIGGMTGLFGITVGLAVVILNLCSLVSLGVSDTAGAAPFVPYSMRDIFIRAGWKTLEKKQLNVEDLPGEELK